MRSPNVTFRSPDEIHENTCWLMARDSGGNDNNLATDLFLGGWHGPASDTIGWVWTLVKTFAVAVVVIWVRVAYPRMREDQLQKIAWQGLVPLALLQLAITAVGVVVTA